MARMSDVVQQTRFGVSGQASCEGRFHSRLSPLASRYMEPDFVSSFDQIGSGLSNIIMSNKEIRKDRAISHERGHP